jgi:uncharacterized protein YndB with AHSA1/START domain
MNKSKKTIEVKVERTIPAPQGDVFDGWLNPKVPGNPWNMADKLILNPKVDGLFYWLVYGTPHDGRFTEVKRPAGIKHTWMSPNTSGLESKVTVTFKKKGDDTLMTLVHSGLPDTEGGRSHEKGWNYFLDLFHKRFTSSSSRKK